MDIHFIYKLMVALIDQLFTIKTSRPPKLIMTLLVKNEEHLLEQNLIFHKEMGVDSFIVTDNNSTDSTPEIIKKYEEKGWIVESIKETSTNYNQKRWVDRMIWLAKRKYRANWVINADADEFWYSPQGDLKHEIVPEANVLRCRVVNMYPEEGVDFWEWSKAVCPIDNAEDYDLSKYSIYGKYFYKVAHATRGYLKISMGNHKVQILNRQRQQSQITVYHYPIFNRERFVRKMKNGGEQMEQNKKMSAGAHWRYFYDLYKAGLIEREYDRVIGSDHIEEFEQSGYLYEDKNVANIFKKMGY